VLCSTTLISAIPLRWRRSYSSGSRSLGDGAIEILARDGGDSFYLQIITDYSTSVEIWSDSGANG
jgi:hypothetical protein